VDDADKQRLVALEAGYHGVENGFRLQSGLSHGMSCAVSQQSEESQLCSAISLAKGVDRVEFREEIR
jgi:hypothetical protein